MSKITILLSAAVLFAGCGRLVPGVRSVAVDANTTTLTKNLTVKVEQAAGGAALEVTDSATFAPNEASGKKIPTLFPTEGTRVRITGQLEGTTAVVGVDFVSRVYDSPVSHTALFSEEGGVLKLVCKMPDNTDCPPIIP
jgi:hypothetical protein